MADVQLSSYIGRQHLHSILKQLAVIAADSNTTPRE